MSWIDPLSSITTLATTAHEVAKSSSTIQKHYQRILYRLQHGKAIIPVFGAGGTGKSTLGKILAGTNPLDLATPYQESITVDQISLEGNVPGHLLVAPGQKDRAYRHWPELIAKVNDGQSFGFINVVSYGYHSIEYVKYHEHEVFSKPMTKKQFLKKYLDFCRQIEISRLKDIFTGLESIDRPLWMVTLVTEQDLWWGQRKHVENHYMQGDFGSTISAFATSRQKDTFQHEFLPVSLTLNNLVTTDGTVLASTASGYDFAHHKRYLELLFTTIDALLEQGAMT